MPALLHILTKQDDALARTIITAQEGENKIVVVDLTKPKPDYNDLLEKVFAADGVEVW